ncbi:MAG: glycosyltransferase [Anaerolineales bacterium]
MTHSFAGRVGIVQRVLPRYRAPFFDLLAEQCAGGLGLFAGSARPSEIIPLADKLNNAQWVSAENLHIFSGRFYFCYQRGLIRWLEYWDPDVLVVEANPRYLSTGVATRWMHERDRPVIGWGLGAPGVHGGLAGSQRNRFLRQFDGLIAYSQRGAVEYRKTGFNAKNIFVAPNAVSPKPKGAAPKRAARFAKGRANVLYVGRLQARKRLDLLLRCCAALPSDIQPNLHIVGDGPERESLERLTNQIYPHTKFNGTLFGPKLDAAFNQADLFVLPGTGGLAVQQAMAHGLPLIVAEGDGSQEDMVRPSNGWLVAAGSEEALTTALDKALSNPARLRKMGSASFRLVQREFNLERMADAFVQALNKVAV